MPKRRDINKVMVIGSGPIVIGQAAEFDYAGTQACLALKEEGYEVILVNSNPATIMTDTHIADKVYMEPLTLEYVAKIIRFERPDAIVPGLGGQTGLNLAVQLAKKGILKECQVEILGTSFESIERARRAASRLYAGRYGRRIRRQRGAAARNDAPRPVPFARAPGARREEHQGLQGDRVRGDARPQRHGHQHLLHGEYRSRGRAYGRLDRRGAVPDAHQ